MVTGRNDIRDLRSDDFFKSFRRDPFTPSAPRDPIHDADIDVAVVGAGMAGVVVGAKLRSSGIRRIRLIDEAGGVGGTWYWNRYPGVMCDVESYIYMPMLEDLGYIPSRKYAFGDEIRRHFEAIAAKYDLVDDALFHTRVEEARWDAATDRWNLRTDRGDELRARYVVVAPGILNLMKLPAIPGMESFRGRSFHSARWDYEYTGGAEREPMTKLADKSVAIIGTGASSIQAVPPLAAAARSLYVFQRTPSAVGIRGNRPTAADFATSLQPGWQMERMLNFQRAVSGEPIDRDMIDDGWTHHFGPSHRLPAMTEGMAPADAMRELEELDYSIMEAHRRRVEEIVEDEKKATILKPYYRYICKRPCFHDEYLDAFNSPNVTLIDCPAGVERITPHGVVVGVREYEVDCIIYATGFEAETTALPRRAGHTIAGLGGLTLMEKWEHGSSTLFGMMSRGFPNMFFMPCPGQQSVVTVNHTLVTVIGAEHVAGTVRILDDRNVASFDVSEPAEADWCEKIRAGFVDASAVITSCTPSRGNFEGDPARALPENGSYGGEFGDFFGYVELLVAWRDSIAAGGDGGLELTTRDASR